MAELLLNSGFQSSLEVAIAGDRALGAWIRMAAWSVHWAEDGTPCPVPKAARRLFGVTKAVTEKLLDANLAVERNGDLVLLGEGELWRQAVPPRNRIPEHIRSFVFERDDHKCQFCGATENLSLDHIKPWSKGGKDTVENLRVLCRSCNSSRGNREDD